uniref:Variant surface glycoprotein 1125.1202 n=1 Tax=Trypanosoma brucei TaxID=5691 RepID=A0A1J0R6R1_9TRYP|nr:variant surface glycoprotein 1125.1202 [Trypanosoma brucei]
MMCIQKRSIKNQNLRLALALAVFHTVTIVTEANIPTGANRQEHAALCAVIALASADLDITDPTKMDDQSFQAIQNLNFSTADDEWKSSFYKNGDTTKVQEEATSYHKNFPGYEQSWPVWVAAATAVGAKTKPQEITDSTADKLSNAARKAVHGKLKYLADAAVKLKEQMVSDEDAPADFTVSTQKAALETAIFGQAGATTATVAADKAFGAAPHNTRATACTADGTNGKAKTAAAQLSCVCHKAGNGHTGVTGACTKAADGDTAWNDGTSGIADTDLQAIAKTCPSGKGSPITSSRLRAAVDNVRQLVHQTSGGAYLGTYLSGTCDGIQANGVCITFPSYAADAKQSFNKLGWPTVLETLATNLDKRISHNIKMTAINTALQKTKDEAIVAIKGAEAEALKLQQQHTRAQAQNDPTAVSKALDNKKNECAQHKDNKKACTNAKCKWKGGEVKTKEIAK